MTHKKLYRSATDKIIAGVCGGLAEYFEIDATIIRLVWALLVIFTGFFPGVVAYIIAALIMPQRKDATVVEATVNKEGTAS